MTSGVIAGATVRLEQSGVIKYTTSSQANGTYSITGVTAGTYLLVGLKPGYDNWSQARTISAGQSLTGQNIAMVPQGTISGGVRDSMTSLPIAGATVRLEQSGAIKYTTTSQADGTYSIGSVTSGTYLLVGLSAGYDNWSQSKTINPGQALTGQNIAMVTQLGSISGGVRDNVTNVALSGATVRLEQSGVIKYITSSQANGTYSITGVAPGTYLLVGLKGGYDNWSQTTTISAGQTLTGQNVAMVPQGTISGGVRDNVTSLPLAGATVRLEQSGVIKYTISSQADGTYSIANVTAGTYLLVGLKGGYDNWSQSKTINPGQTLTGQNIAMIPQQGAISGGVRDNATSLPISGATVRLEQSGVIKYITTSQANGTYSITSVSAGTYLLVGLKSGYTNWSQSKTIGAGQSLLDQNIALVSSPNQPPVIAAGSLVQYRADGVTSMAVGASTGDATLVMKATLNDPESQAVQLDVEVRPVGTSFGNSPNCTSGSAVASGTVASATCSSLAPGSYHWQARGRDGQGAASAWQSAGGNAETSADFVVAASSPGAQSPVFVPLYRLYYSNAAAGVRDHFYTTSPIEKSNAEAAGYTFERIEGYISNRAFDGGTPLYRLYSGGLKSHYYTVDPAERDAKISAGYASEGTQGYVYAGNSPGAVQLRRFHQTSGTTSHYVLVVRATEYSDLAGRPEWSPDGTVGYVSAFGLQNAQGHQRAQAAIEGVDTATGAYREAYSQQGFTFHGFGPPFVFSLHYNSQNYMQRPLAPGWSHSFNAFIVEGADGSVIVKWGDGSESFFAKSGSSYLPARGNYDTLIRVSDPVNTGYNLVTKDQSRYLFREVGLNESIDPNLPSVQLIGIQDRYGNTIDLQRTLGILLGARDAAGRSLTFQYDSVAQYRLTSVTDSQLGRSVFFQYDDATGNLVGFRDARGHTTQFAYDANQRLTTVTRPRGNSLSLGYDAEGRVTSRRDGFNRLTSYEYNFSGVPGTTRVTDSLQHSLTLSNDPSEFLVKGVQDALGNAASVLYGDAANATLPTRVTDKRNNSTSFTYDSRGNVLSITDALGNVATFTYDANNNLLSKTDFRSSGDLARTTSFLWDAAKKTLVDVNDPLGHNTHFTYNTQGQPVTVRDGNGYASNLTYDAQFNLQKVTDPLGNVTEYGYDTVGRRTSVKDALSKVTSYQYDENDNVVRVTDADGQQATLQYDLNDNREQISYVRSGVTDTIQYAYDNNDRLQTVTDPLGGLYQYAYNEVGDLISRTDAKGQATNYTYDQNHHLTLISYQGAGRTVSLSYDPNGNRIGMDESDLPEAHVFDYDPLNRLIRHRNTYDQTVAYTYDAAGNRTSTVYPGSGRTVSYQYDLGNRLTQVTDWTGGQVTYTYDNADNLARTTHPNGTRAEYAYDLASRLTSIAHRKSDNSLFASYSFVLDPVGNQTSVITVEPLALQPPTAADITYTIGKDNRLLSETGGITYAYDANGNRISKSSPDGTTTYVYDIENRLTQVAAPSGTSTYTYDGLGNRIAKAEGSTPTRYVLDLAGDMSQVIAETDGNNSITAYYIYGRGLLGKIDAQTGQHYVYHADSRGGTVAMTDGAQSIRQAYAYDEFGAAANSLSSLANPFKYVGQWGVMAEDNGLQFMRARFYDEVGGRFLNKDPIGFGSGDWNLYSYASPNPLSAIDPLGLAAATLPRKLTSSERARLQALQMKFAADSAHQDYVQAEIDVWEKEIFLPLDVGGALPGVGLGKCTGQIIGGAITRDRDTVGKGVVGCAFAGMGEALGRLAPAAASAQKDIADVSMRVLEAVPNVLDFFSGKKK